MIQKSIFIMLWSVSFLMRANGLSQILSLAGTGSTPDSGEGTPATSANTQAPRGIHGTLDGTIFVAENGGNKIRRIGTNGIITTSAGTGVSSVGGAAAANNIGDGGRATSATFFGLCQIFVDTLNKLYVADTSNNKVRMIDMTTSVITSVEGSGNNINNGDGLKATSSGIDYLTSVFVDRNGTMYVSETGGHRVRIIIKSTQIMTTLAGTGIGSAVGASTSALIGDGGFATSCTLSGTYQLFADTAYGLFIPDAANAKIRYINLLTNIITCLAGTGLPSIGIDNIRATSTTMSTPCGMFGDKSGNIFMGDYGASNVRKVTASTSIISLVAGSSVASTLANLGDGGPPTAATMAGSNNVFVDTTGSVFVAEESNHRVRKICDFIPTASPSFRPTYYTQTLSRIASVAGNGFTLFNGDGLQATNSALNNPHGVSGDSVGTIHISEYTGMRVRQIDPNSGILTTIVGSGASGPLSADGTRATSATLNHPHLSSFDKVNNKLYIADATNLVIRVLSSTLGTIAVYAGGGATSYIGEGRAATSSLINTPSSVYFRPSDGSVYYAELGGNFIRRVSPSTMIIYTIAGTGTSSATGASSLGNIGDGGPATSATISSPYQIYADTVTSVYFSDKVNQKIRVVNTANGIIRTFAGTGDWSTSGDYGRASSATLAYPTGVYSDSFGVIYILESNGHRLRRVDSTNIITASAGTPGYSSPDGTSTSSAIGDGGLATLATMRVPVMLFIDTTNALYLTDLDNNRVRMLYGFAPTSQPSSQPSIRPSVQPSLQPNIKPSVQPTNQPSSRPTRRPSVRPPQQPSTQPSTHPSSQPSDQPSRCPSSQPVSVPSGQPSVQPSRHPSLQPIGRPSIQPSLQPTIQPSMQPLTRPSSQPSGQPTRQPLTHPSIQPSSMPSIQPSGHPSAQLSRHPSCQPTMQPSSRPSDQPSNRPSHQPSNRPSEQPSCLPSGHPSGQPSSFPQSHPTYRPSGQPSASPSGQPSQHPSQQPINQPSRQPSKQPSNQPSSHPSAVPTVCPTIQPIGRPSCRPISNPTVQPSVKPSGQPSTLPSGQPSGQPTKQPSTCPSVQPFCRPSRHPSVSPSDFPTVQPSIQPTRVPSSNPSSKPSCQPSSMPSTQLLAQPSSSPSKQPTSCPSSIPTMQPNTPPSQSPSFQPRPQPSSQPTGVPSLQPSSSPTCTPSIQPANFPSRQPVATPSCCPSIHPKSKPSVQPSTQPARHPTNQPSRQPSRVPSCAPSTQPSTEPTKLSSIFNSSLSVKLQQFNSTLLKIVLPYLFTSPVTGMGFTDIHISTAVAGVNYVVYVSELKRIASLYDVSQLDLISHAISYDFSGRSVSNAGDVNGDGNDDLIIGVPYSALCYVLFGTELGFVNMTGGFTIFGSQLSDLTGWSVSAAGDVNNDTYADVIIGAPYAQNSHGAVSGVSYVVFGSRGNFRADIMLSKLIPQIGVKLEGATSEDGFGLSVAKAGDVNGDGFDDVIIGALMLSNKFSGAIYMVYGGQSDMNMLNGFTITGFAWAWFGYSVSGAGDVNSDGCDDFVVGSAPRRQTLSTPISYIIYGNQTSVKTRSVSLISKNEIIQIVGAGIVVNYIRDKIVLGNYGLDSGGGFVVTSTIISTSSPSIKQTATPSTQPSQVPHQSPSSCPTTSPTRPTAPPNAVPSGPSEFPTVSPSHPTELPSVHPTTPTICPSKRPSFYPSLTPSVVPSRPPTTHPSAIQTVEPSWKLSVLPTTAGSTPRPTLQNTLEPTRYPVVRPSISPTLQSTVGATNASYTQVFIPTGGVYLRTMNNTHYIVNSTQTVSVTGFNGNVWITLVPNSNTTLRLSYFDTSKDLIDLRFFTEIRSMSDLGFKSDRMLAETSGNKSVLLSFENSQFIEIVNVVGVFSDKCFIFYKPLVQDPNNTTHANNTSPMLIGASVVVVFFGFIFIRMLFMLYEYQLKKQPIIPIDWNEVGRTNPTYVSFNDGSFNSELSFEPDVSDDDDNSSSYSSLSSEDVDSIQNDTQNKSDEGESKSEVNSDTGQNLTRYFQFAENTAANNQFYNDNYNEQNNFNEEDGYLSEFTVSIDGSVPYV